MLFVQHPGDEQQIHKDLDARIAKKLIAESYSAFQAAL